VAIVLGLIGTAAAVWTIAALSSAMTTKRNEAVWLTAAQHALRDPPWQCRPSWEPVEKVDLPGLGTVDNICVGAGGVVSFVQNKRTGSGFAPSGVIYSAASVAPTVQPDSCVAPISGSWWRFVPADPDCPSGYQVVGGG